MTLMLALLVSLCRGTSSHDFRERLQPKFADPDTVYQDIMTDSGVYNHLVKCLRNIDDLTPRIESAEAKKLYFALLPKMTRAQRLETLTKIYNDLIDMLRAQNPARGLAAGLRLSNIVTLRDAYGDELSRLRDETGVTI